MFKPPTETLWRQWAPLPLRLMIGFGFMAHGWAKLSRGPAGFAKLLEQIGAPLPGVMAWVSTFVEILGGLAIFTGAFVAIVSVPLIIMMFVAMFTVHLRYGAGLASGVTGLGLAMSLAGVEGTPVVAAGVALFIALPVLRVLVMLGAFILNQDYRLVLVAAVVLMTILAGLVIGLSSSNTLAH